MRIAVLTMVFDEAVFLPLWIRHYGKQFGFGNLFVIDDGSTDGSTRTAPIRLIARKQRTPLDEDDRAMLVSRIHEALLRFYDLAIHTDVDEFIVVDPDYPADLAG